MRPLPALVASFALLVALGGRADGASLPAAATVSAAQGASHAAGLVIATPDGEVKTVCVRFSEESIDGRQLLDRAEAERGDIDPVYAQFGSRGTAVCSLCGTGCSSGDCFCQDAYWNYNVAHEGRWVRSGTGVQGRTVEHGDVDGWAFGGDGAAPPYLSFEQICGEATGPAASPAAEEPAAEEPATSPSPSPAGQASPPTSPSPAEPPPGSAPDPTEDPAVAGGPGSPAPPSPTTAVPAPVDDDPGDAPSPTAPAPEDDTPPLGAGGEAGGTTGAALAFLALLSALVAATVWQRRRHEP